MTLKADYNAQDSQKSEQAILKIPLVNLLTCQLNTDMLGL